MSLERRKLPSPHRVSLLEPVSERRHRLRPQTIDSNPRIKLVTILLDETAAAKRLEVTAHGGEGELGCFRQLSRPVRSLTQKIDHAPSIRVRKRSQRPIEIGCAHFSLLNLNPVAASISALVTSRSDWAKVQ